MPPGWGDQDAVITPGIPFLLQRCKAIIQVVELHIYHAREPGPLSRLGSSQCMQWMGATKVEKICAHDNLQIKTLQDHQLGFLTGVGLHLDTVFDSLIHHSPTPFTQFNSNITNHLIKLVLLLFIYWFTSGFQMQDHYSWWRPTDQNALHSCEHITTTIS